MGRVDYCKDKGGWMLNREKMPRTGQVGDACSPFGNSSHFHSAAGLRFLPDCLSKRPVEQYFFLPRMAQDSEEDC